MSDDVESIPGYKQRTRRSDADPARAERIEFLRTVWERRQQEAADNTVTNPGEDG